MSETPDAELMARTARGDERAFAELVVRYQDVLLNFFLRKGVSYHDGQDLAQRTLLRLWRYRNRYAPTAKLTTFLFLLAGQVAIDFFRAEGHRHGLEEELERQAEVEATSGTMSTSGETSAGCRPPDPDDGGSGERVRRAVASLPPGMRDVVELGVFQDLPYADVSEILGIPEGTVKSRMFNALRKLKELMDERRSGT
jgi:RNA polymerase sigma-70 factor (ECF subfamily)